MDERLNEDFSIDWLDDSYVSRREFFKFMTLASGGLAAGSAVLAAWPHLRREGATEGLRMRIASVEDVAVGESVSFRYPSDKDLCILVRRSESEFVAYSRRCSHLSCPVQYESRKSRLYCPCHNGAFSLDDGRPTQGPPAAPLRQIALEVEDGAVFAVGRVDP